MGSRHAEKYPSMHHTPNRFRIELAYCKLQDILGRPVRGCISGEKAPRLNWTTQFLTMAYDGAFSPNVSVRMAWISSGALPCKKKKLMTVRVSMLLKSRASPDTFHFSLCNKKRIAIRHMNKPIFPTTLSIPSNDIGEVGLSKDLSALSRIILIITISGCLKFINTLSFFPLLGCRRFLFWNNRYVNHISLFEYISCNVYPNAKLENPGIQPSKMHKCNTTYISPSKIFRLEIKILQTL